MKKIKLFFKKIDNMFYQFKRRFCKKLKDNNSGYKLAEMILKLTVLFALITFVNLVIIIILLIILI